SGFHAMILDAGGTNIFDDASGGDAQEELTVDPSEVVLRDPQFVFHEFEPAAEPVDRFDPLREDLAARPRRAGRTALAAGGAARRPLRGGAARSAVRVPRGRARRRARRPLRHAARGPRRPTRLGRDDGTGRRKRGDRQRLGHQRPGQIPRCALPRLLAAPAGDGRRRSGSVPHPLGHRVPGHRAPRPGRLRAGARSMTATLPQQRPSAPAPAPHRAPRRELRKSLILAVGVVVSVLALLTAVTIGTAGVGLGDVIHSLRVSLLGGTISTDFASTYSVITQLRLPRVLLAFTAGAALSVSGVLMQGLLRNPLVSPFTLGVSPAAAFGAALVITLAGTQQLPAWATIAGARVMALTVSAVVLGIATARRMAVATLLLLGIAMTQIFEALTSALQFSANENTLQAISRWTFRSANDAVWSDVLVVGVVTLIALPLTLLFAKDLNAIAFAGDDAASSFGVNVGPVRVGLIALAVTLAAVVVSFCGIIGFVGLVGPHIARLAIGADHRHLLPFAALSGGLLLLVADAVGRTVIAPAVVPVGIVVAFIGGPVFIYLVLTRRNTLK